MADPTLLVPGNGAKNMEPLWNKDNAAIRTVDPTTIVFFEGSTYDIFSGFNNVPGGDGSKTAHSYHYYNYLQLGKIKTRPLTASRMPLASRQRECSLSSTFGTREQRAAPGFLTRLGLQTSTCSRDKTGHMRTCGIARPSSPSLNWLGSTRTYAKATAGATKTLYFQDETSKNWVSWVADTSIAAPGLIRISPQIYYQDGIRAFLVPAGSGTYTMDGTNIVQLHYTVAAQSGQTIQASVQPFLPIDIIKNPATGKCVDNGNNYVTPNNSALIWTCSSAASHVWRVKNGAISLAFDPSRKSDTYCLDTLGDASASSQTVVLNPCQAASASQQ
ncbi:hypothetical protein BG006_010672 [Podila minutissima]|uniref:Ricin B lectin domain-containing protein n=1 Tax=Podila minutissima TaxID=64525 RepID=A0A9P5SSM2_9FUNG|nr:hypothetical protein BG006_010672 [Podila minutissima]